MPKLPSVIVVAAATLMIATTSGVASDSTAILHDGTWTTKGYQIQGGWRIVEEGGQPWIELDADFQTRRAPDLKIFLSPRRLEELGDHNATEGSHLVAELRAPRGAQRYPLEDIDLAKYRTVLIHCQRYSKLWGGAELQPNPP